MNKIKYRSSQCLKIRETPKKPTMDLKARTTPPKLEVYANDRPKREMYRAPKSHNVSTIAATRRETSEIVSQKDKKIITPGYTSKKYRQSSESPLDKLKTYFNNIETKNNDLLIIDQYLFSKGNRYYKQLLINIFKTTKFNKLNVITNEEYFNKSFYDEVIEGSGIKSNNVNLITSKNYHDRFWISSKKKGFVMGTSLNGFGKKMTYIDLLKQEDVNYILDYVEDDLEIIL